MVLKCSQQRRRGTWTRKGRFMLRVSLVSMDASIDPKKEKWRHGKIVVEVIKNNNYVTTNGLLLEQKPQNVP